MCFRAICYIFIFTRRWASEEYDKQKKFKSIDIQEETFFETTAEF